MLIVLVNFKLLLKFWVLDLEIVLFVFLFWIGCLKYDILKLDIFMWCFFVYNKLVGLIL